ncbi:MAG: hypothetical protein EAS52_18550 [Parapedobacter sp.]|nr:MAG: hypothetical protein EAS52_18550 [Parapedobacter sp.]
MEQSKSRNPKGRPLGSANRLTADVRLKINHFLDVNWPEVQSLYEKMRPEDKMAFMLRLLEFSVPKLRAIDVQTLQAQKVDALSPAQVEAMLSQILLEEGQKDE